MYKYFFSVRQQNEYEFASWSSSFYEWRNRYREHFTQFGSPCSALTLSHFLHSSLYLVLPIKTLVSSVCQLFSKYQQIHQETVYCIYYNSSLTVQGRSHTCRLQITCSQASSLTSLCFSSLISNIGMLTSHGIVDGLYSLIRAKLLEQCLAHNDGSHTVSGTLTLQIGNGTHYYYQ